MKIVVEDISAVRKKLTIEVLAEEVASAFKEAYNALKQDAVVEGFRKGKAPEKILRQRFGDRMTSSVAEKLVEKTYPEAVKEKGLRPTSFPQIDIERVGEGLPFSYSATIDVKPKVDVSGYMDLDIEKRSIEVTQEEVTQSINLLRERHSEYAPVDREIQSGDMVTMDFYCTEGETLLEDSNTKDYTMIVGETAPFPEFDDVLKGARCGALQFKKTFQKDFKDKRLSGKEVAFHIIVKSVKEKKLPVIDDEFAKDLSFKEMEELRKRLKEDIAREKERAEENRRRDEAIAVLIEKNPFEVPESLINTYIKRFLNNMLSNMQRSGVNLNEVDLTSEDMKAKCHELAFLHARTDILLDAIAEKESIEVSSEDMDRALKPISLSRGETIEALKTRLSGEGSLEPIKEEIRREKAWDFILSERRIIMP